MVTDTKLTQNVRIIAIYVTMGTTNINLISFVLHSSGDICASEIDTKCAE